MKLTRDYSYCTIYVDTFDITKIAEIVLALNKAKCISYCFGKKFTIPKVPQLVLLMILILTNQKVIILIIYIKNNHL